MALDNAILLGAKTAKRWFASREFDPAIVDYLYYGTTVAQYRMFYSHNWAAGIIAEGKRDVPGLMVNQACTTSATCIKFFQVRS